MNHARRGHSATLLKDGKVFVFGGVGESGTVLDVWEIFDPKANTWTDGAVIAPVRRTEHAATLLPSGKVILVGGRDQSGTIQATTQYFDPGSDPFEGGFVGRAPMTTPRAGCTCAPLPGGRVLVAFGDTPAGPTNKSEVHDPTADAWTPTDPLKDGLQPRGEGHRSIVLLNGKVLAVAGIETPTPGATEQEIYDPELSQWFATGTEAPLGTPWTEPAAVVLLTSGAPLIAGGARGGAVLTVPGTDDARTLPLGLTNKGNCPLLFVCSSQTTDGRPWLSVSGERFASREAASGANNQLSSAAPPVVITTGIESEQMSPAAPARGTWADTYFHGTLPAGTIPGQYRVTVISGGVPSVSKIIQIKPESPPDNPDADNDGFGALTDCDDTNPLVWSRPGEVRNLKLTHDPAVGATTLLWQAPVILGAASVVYDTLMSGNPADFVADALCVESDDGTDTEAVTPTAPPPGAVHSFLVRGQSACPDGGGPLGQRSDGATRVGRPCP